MKQVLQKPETSGRLLKWAVELAQFDIEYVPRVAIKAQALADFVSEFSKEHSEQMPDPVSNAAERDPKFWELYVDGSSNDQGSGAGLVLSNSEGIKARCALRFAFKSTNNEAEYEALIAGLRLAIKMKVQFLKVFKVFKYFIFGL